MLLQIFLTKKRKIHEIIEIDFFSSIKISNSKSCTARKKHFYDYFNNLHISNQLNIFSLQSVVRQRYQ